MMECWNDGNRGFFPKILIFQYSIIPDTMGVR